MAEGGWSPARSLEVEWGSELFRPGQGPSFFYKSGDGGEFDLNYAPQQDPINIAEGVRIMEWYFDQWRVMVQEKMMLRIWGFVSLHADIPKAEFEDKVWQSVRLARAEFQRNMILAAVATNARRREPDTIATFFPSNMILGPSNIIFVDRVPPSQETFSYDTESEDAGCAPEIVDDMDLEATDLEDSD